MVQLFVFNLICFWTIGAVLLVNNYRNELARWLAYTVLLAGCGSLSISLNQVLFPYLDAQGLAQHPLREPLRLLGMGASLLYYHFMPYAFFISSTAFCFPTASLRLKTALRLLLLAPPVLLIVHAPRLHPVLEIDLDLLRPWAGGCVFLGIALFIAGCMRARKGPERSYHIRIGTVVSLTMLYGFVTDYLNVDAILIQPDRMIVASPGGYWIYNFIIVLFMAVLFTYFAGRYGFLGIKLRIEKQKFDYSMRTLTQGTAILNHSLKNEIQKLHYLGERVRRCIEENRKDEALQTVDSWFQVTGHMHEMVQRIREKTAELELRDGSCRVSALIGRIAAEVGPLMESRRMKLDVRLAHDADIVCDEPQLKEVLHNLVMNAIDAMRPEEGVLLISVNKIGKDLLIEVRDNGSGVEPENASRIFEPFFTTKRGRENYGLGLSYCLSVLQKHGGALQLIDTARAKGTAFGVRLPGRRVREWHQIRPPIYQKN